MSKRRYQPSGGVAASLGCVRVWNESLATLFEWNGARAESEITGEAWYECSSDAQPEVIARCILQRPVGKHKAKHVVVREEFVLGAPESLSD